MSPTIREIAKKAKVSIATVSRVLNHQTRHKVRPDTLEKIDRLIRQTGFSPNLAARNLRSSHYQMIGVLVPHTPGIFLNDYYIKFLSGISDIILEKPYQFKLIMLKGQGKWDHYHFKVSEGVDGLIISHWPVFFTDLRAIQKLRLPVVVTNEAEQDFPVSVGCDHREGGRICAEYFYQKGHRRMAVMKGPDWSSDSLDRYQGFVRFLADQKISVPDEWIFCGNFSRENAREAMNVFLNESSCKAIHGDNSVEIQKKPPFTALFCMNDAMAFGVLDSFRQYGIQCPRDVSVIGFDDETGSAYSNPPLTTIRQPVYEMARKGTSLLLELIEKPGSSNSLRREVLPVQFVERESVQDIQ